MKHTATSDHPPTFVVGDVHGCFDALCELLRQADLLAPDLSWNGGKHQLWLLGDLVDRGPASLAVVDLIMQLQRQANAVGGGVTSLLGNHELYLLAARRFGERPVASTGGTFQGDWLRYGGVAADLAALTDAQADWLGTLPAAARVGGHLLLHADDTFYGEYGDTVEGVNAALRAAVSSDDAAAWEHVLRRYERRRAFGPNRAGGWRCADRVLKRFKAARLVHGHTPIGTVARDWTTGPLIYANGRCVNVDAGLYLGYPGFVYRLPPLGVAMS